MTIADKFNYLNNTKKAIKNALINKGVEVSDSDSFRSYADKVASIETDGGSGAEITEVRCDPANFPVQAEKKVILAYTGEQPAAEKNLLAPFDYKTNWNNGNVTPLQNSEYDFIMQNGSYSLAYKKEDEKYALSYLVSQPTSKNAKLALGKYNLFLSDDSATTGYCLPKRFNRQAKIEDIIFDVEPEVPTGNYTSNYLTKVILPTYDDKYIWVFYRYYSNSAVATSQPKVYIYKLRYVENEDKLYADKIAEYTQSVATTYPIHNAKQSADDYTFLFEYSGRREWLRFNDETNTVEFKASSGSSTEVSFLKKDWFINASGNVYTYELLDDGTCSQTKTITLSYAYYMEPFEGVLWNRGNKWLVYDTIPTSDNIKEVQVTGVPYRDRIILEYDTSFKEILFKKVLNDGTIEDLSVPDPYGIISFIDDEGRIRGVLKGSSSITVTQPVDGSYTNGIQEAYKISISGQSLLSMNGGHVTGIKNGKGLIYGYNDPKILKGFNSEVSSNINWQCYVFEDVMVFTGSKNDSVSIYNTKIAKITDDYAFIAYSNSSALFKRYAFKINETYFLIAVDGSVYRVIFDEDALTYTPEPLYQDSSLSFSSTFYPSSVINTKDGKYIIIPEANKYFEISGTETEPSVQLKDFPEVLKTSLSSSVRFVQAFYDKSFGIQLKNGSYLMCRYDEGIDIDLSIEEYAPRLYDYSDKTIMYYTQNKNYWMSYIDSSGTPNISAYAVGKGLTIPSHYKMTAFPNTSTYYNSGILTGFMTGEVVKEDEAGSKIIKVRTALPEEEGTIYVNYNTTEFVVPTIGSIQTAEVNTKILLVSTDEVGGAGPLNVTGDLVSVPYSQNSYVNASTFNNLFIPTSAYEETRYTVNLEKTSAESYHATMSEANATVYTWDIDPNLAIRTVINSDSSWLTSVGYVEGLNFKALQNFASAGANTLYGVEGAFNFRFNNSLYGAMYDLEKKVFVQSPYYTGARGQFYIKDDDGIWSVLVYPRSEPLARKFVIRADGNFEIIDSATVTLGTYTQPVASAIFYPLTKSGEAVVSFSNASDMMIWRLDRTDPANWQINRKTSLLSDMVSSRTVRILRAKQDGNYIHIYVVFTSCTATENVAHIVYDLETDTIVSKELSLLGSLCEGYDRISAAAFDEGMTRLSCVLVDTTGALPAKVVVLGLNTLLPYEYAAVPFNKANLSDSAVTGFIKSQDGTDEFGNPIATVETVLDPNATPLSADSLIG